MLAVRIWASPRIVIFLTHKLKAWLPPFLSKLFPNRGFEVLTLRPRVAYFTHEPNKYSLPASFLRGRLSFLAAIKMLDMPSSDPTELHGIQEYRNIGDISSFPLPKGECQSGLAYPCIICVFCLQEHGSLRVHLLLGTSVHLILGQELELGRLGMVGLPSLSLGVTSTTLSI